MEKILIIVLIGLFSRVCLGNVGICNLPKDAGTCGNFVVKWHYDATHGSCSRFWYGGCDGNDNAFDTQNDCESTCKESTAVEDDDVGGSAASRLLQLSQLDYYVNTPEGRSVLEAEYESIKGGQRRPWTVAALPENKEKNRHDDLIPYDATRVILHRLPEDPHSDYINANYITGTNGPREYVATQGPKSNTINDFWRMIWQLNATKIVMLANLFEHGKPKVDKYWPETRAKYGDITVAMISEHTIPQFEHVVRTFIVTKLGIAKPRIIRHFHFTGWPDLGVPANRLSLVSLMLQARKYRPDSTAPIVVHCSAGIGRTGTTIMTDSMIQKAKVEGVVDFPKRLDSMRLQRVDVVEKKEQYVFGHQAVYDIFYGSDTENYLKRVEDEYTKLDSNVNANDFIAPDNLPEALEKIKSHNSAMMLLIDQMIEHAQKSSSQRSIH